MSGRRVRRCPFCLVGGSGAWRTLRDFAFGQSGHAGYSMLGRVPPFLAQDSRFGGPKGDEKPKGTESFTHPYTVFNFYAQSISLNKVNFFGLGNDTALAGKSLFRTNQTIAGGSVIKPVFEWAAIRWLNLALLGEVDRRFVDIRGEQGQSAPSIETLHTDTTAPGLGSQPGFVQLGEACASSRRLEICN